MYMYVPVCQYHANTDSYLIVSISAGHARQDSMDPFDTIDGEKCLCCKDGELDIKSIGQRPLKTLERRRKRQQERCKAHSLVGTPNYIAPEVLQKIGEELGPNVGLLQPWSPRPCFMKMSSLWLS